MSTIFNKAVREISRLKACDPNVNAYHFAYVVSHADYEKIRAELAPAEKIDGVFILGIRVVPVS